MKTLIREFNLENFLYICEKNESNRYSNCIETGNECTSHVLSLKKKEIVDYFQTVEGGTTVSVKAKS